MSAPLSLHEVMVLALYTVTKTPGPVPRSVVETALDRCNVNGFDIQNAIYDLIENAQLEQKTDEDGTEYLIPSPLAADVAETLKKDTPLSYREKALAFAQEEMVELRRQIGVFASTEPIGSEKEPAYNCRLTLKDTDLTLLDLNFYAPNKIQSQLIENRFRKDPLTVYRKILRILTETDAEPRKD